MVFSDQSLADPIMAQRPQKRWLISGILNLPQDSVTCVSYDRLWNAYVPDEETILFDVVVFGMMFL
jgi:hypothetical protein